MIKRGVSIRGAYWRGLAVAGLVGTTFSAGSYLAFRLFWVRASLDLARLLIFVGPIMCSVVLALVLLKHRGWTAALGALTAAGFTLLPWSIFATGACDMGAHRPIIVKVVDGRSGAVMPYGNSIIMSEGNFSVKLHDVLDSMHFFERPGTYTVTVTRPGYEPWERRGVRVRRELRCEHVKTVTLTARLVPTR